MGNGPSKPSPEEAERLGNELDNLCAQAASIIDSADVLLIVTGAGFSADSGLAVYNDIARIEPYSERGLGYMDLCEPHWLHSEPDLFYGFWGGCFNDYRDTQPHIGYEIIARWREEKNNAPVAGEMQQQIRQEAAESWRDSNSEVAGAFFIFTSNVDAHSFDYFKVRPVAPEASRIVV
jgi:hypothetical protein